LKVSADEYLITVFEFILFPFRGFGTRLAGQVEAQVARNLMELSSPKPARLLHRTFEQSEDASAPALQYNCIEVFRRGLGGHTNVGGTRGLNRGSASPRAHHQARTGMPARGRRRMGEGDLRSLNARAPVEPGEVRRTGITTIGDVPWGFG
jgi:hypothetical protein